MEFYLILGALYLIGMYVFNIMSGEEFSDYPEWMQSWISVLWFVPAITVWVWHFGHVLWTIPRMVIFQINRLKK